MQFLSGTYHPGLVMLSVFVATTASCTAISLTWRVVATRGGTSVLWLCGGALAMGCCIWSMHFVGMLAFSLQIRMSYDIGTTVQSLLVAIAVSAFALRIVTRASVSRAHDLLGGLPMDLGICGMHYMVMHATNMSPAIS